MTTAKTQTVIWARAAGHCQYAGCNHSLIGDLISGNEEILQTFRRLMRRLFDDIKASGAEAIHIFPAIPVSTAVEIGRVWMPKADLPLVTYDETRGRGFVERLRIG